MAEFAAAVVFLCLTLLAMVVAVFTIAVSFLGRALQQARADQEDMAEKEKAGALARSEQLSKDIGKVRDKLKGEDADQAIRELKKKLRLYEKEKKKSEKASRRTSPKYRTYRLLTVPGGVLPTSAWLLVSFSLATVTQLFTTAVGYAPLGVSALALGWACFRIYRSLKVIQEVAVTTEEAQFKREAEALETALERQDEKKRPKLEVKSIKPKSPIKLKPSEEKTIEIIVRLIQGGVGKSAEFFLFSREGVDFPENTTWRQSESSSRPEAITTNVALGDIRMGIRRPFDIKIKAPPEARHCTVEYRLICDGFIGHMEKFDIVVAE